MRTYSIVACAAVAVLAGCAPAPGVPLQVAHCNVAVAGSQISVAARVSNTGDRPMASAVIVLDMYRNYRFTRASGTVKFVPVLDPGSVRAVRFNAPVAKGASSGAAMNCVATQAVFADGTVQSAGG